MNSQRACLYLDGPEGIKTESITCPNGDYRTYYQNFAKHLQANEPNPVSAESALLVIQIIEACYKSHHEMRWIEHRDCY